MVSYDIVIKKHDSENSSQDYSENDSRDDSENDSRDDSENDSRDDSENDFREDDEKIDRIYHIHNRKNNQLMVINEHDVDGIVFKVLQEFRARADFGYKKYGTDLDREDLTFIEWIQHAKEEHMDAILYLEKIRQDEIKRLDRTKKDKTETRKLYNMIGELATYSVIVSFLLAYVIFLKYY